MSNVLKISDEEALDLCARQENDFFDRKSARIKPAQIQDVAVAFANAEGGTVVVGIEDAGKFSKAIDRWAGAPDIEHYNEIIASLASLNPGIDFRHEFLFREGGFARNYVLRMEIRKSLKVHETAKNEVHIRKGAQSLHLKGMKVQELMRAKGMTSEEDAVLPNVSPDSIIEGEYLKSYLAALPVTNKDSLGFSLQERLLHEQTLDPTVACVLLFASNPSSVMPRQCAVKIVRYNSSHEEIERDSLTEDRHSIEGPLHDQIKRSFKTLQEVIARCECWTIDGLRSPTYPNDAVYELLVNSVLHRDYGVSDNVLISVYRNRIEFRSPGRLPGFVTTTNILDARFSRNPKMVRLLSKYPDAPNKDLGEGINTVFERMRQAGFVDPIFREDGANLHVTLKREPRSDAADIIAKFVSKHGAINNRQALDLLALETTEQVTAIFSRLREQGVIAREDEKQTGVRVRWVKAKPLPGSSL